MWTIVAFTVVVLAVFVISTGVHLSQEAARKRLEARRVDLTRRFGAEVAERILACEVWQGQTAEQVVEALGPPVDTEEKVLKTKVKTTLKYDQRTAKAFGLRVFLEDGLVVGWERK